MFRLFSLALAENTFNEKTIQKKPTMLSELIEQVGSFTFSGRMMLLGIITAFMPLSAMTFFFYSLDKKEKDFGKALRDMGIQSSRKVRDTYRAGHYLLPLFFVTFICFLSMFFILFADNFLAINGDSLLLTGADFGMGDNQFLMRRSAVAIGFAFLGGFIWSATNIVRRLIEYDLSPNVYYTAGIRIILAGTVSVTLSFLLPDLTENALPAISLLAGMFPERVLNWFIDKYKNFIDGDRILDKQMAIENIEGVSVSHKERLREIGIDNAQNLAETSFLQLLIKTPFETRQLLDWIGQAKLVIYAKSNTEALRDIGIRSVFDFFKGNKDKVILQDIAESRGIDPAMMGLIYEHIVNDEGIIALYNFQRKMNLPDGD